ncbi:hypothetical protein [Neorhizobium galegae]|uniref:hypothetical protein n=1 Tax=Neorhizobium galegae TaxID=399 RepID=UPI001FCAE718|nr:hypothetical protein [Neorhizobium galegae]
MAAFSLPAFSRLSPKIARAERELEQLEIFFARHSQEVSDREWGALSAISLGIHNVYNGIEDSLLSLARDVDALVPSGPTMHQDVPDVGRNRRHTAVRYRHGAIRISDGSESLPPSRRHRYGFDLKADKVIENLDRIREAFPSFVDAVVRLEKTMAAEDTDDDGDGTAGTPGR